MEHKTKNLGTCKFIDDYAHHPSEIKATLKAIREKNPKAKILCIFQPHQYNRTRLLLKDFGKAFEDANKVIIPNIYEVRDNEEDIKAVSSKDLANEINKHKNKAKSLETLEKTADFIKENHEKFDIIITMGAGDIDKIYKMF
jgi:UDP-N-acetylmuramate--alanine ligase